MTVGKRAFLLPVVLALLSPPAAAGAQSVDPAFKADIEKLLVVTGSAQMGKQAATLISGQILEALKKARPDIPPRVVEVAQEVLDSEFAKAFDGPDNLTARMIPIYAKHFTPEDVRGLLAFYNSELGKKSVTVMPVVFREAAAVGQQWAQEHMPAISSVLEARLRAEGFGIKK
jgi:hypothetical protein